MEDDQLMSFLDIVCSALGASILLFILFLDIGGSLPGDRTGGRFLTGNLDFDLKPGMFRIDIVPPGSEKGILLNKSDLQNEQKLQSKINALSEFGTAPTLFFYQPGLDPINRLAFNFTNPVKGCWKFRISYLSPESNANYYSNNELTTTKMEWMTHKMEKSKQHCTNNFGFMNNTWHGKTSGEEVYIGIDASCEKIMTPKTC